MANRSFVLRDEENNYLGTFWLSSTQDCGHEVFQVNFKHRLGVHRYRSICTTCGIRDDLGISAVLDEINAVRRQLGLAEV